MKATVVGVYSGTSKKNGNPFWMLYYNVARDMSGLRGCVADFAFCTKDVAENAVPGVMYELIAPFGSKTVTEIIPV